MDIGLFSFHKIDIESRCQRPTTSLEVVQYPQSFLIASHYQCIYYRAKNTWCIFGAMKQQSDPLPIPIYGLDAFLTPMDIHPLFR